MKIAPALRVVTGMLCAALLFAAGCSRSPAARFYILHTLTDAATERPAGAVENGIAIGLGPILLPEYLDRPQIVTRVSPNEVKFAEFYRWAEPLKDDFASHLARTLSILLATDRVAIYPWTNSTPVELQVKIDVIRFDGQLGRNVVLQTTWAVFGKDPANPLLSREFTVREAVDTKGYDGLVEAHSRAVAGFGREIAEAVRRLSPERSIPSPTGN
jgi:uncharacterized lipoprotein YmbA